MFLLVTNELVNQRVDVVPIERGDELLVEPFERAASGLDELYGVKDPAQT